MLGPLPSLYRFGLVLALVVIGTGVGLLLGAAATIPLDVRVGLLAGSGAGVAAAFVLVHDFHERSVHHERSRRRTP